MSKQQEKVQFGLSECAIAFFSESSTDAAPEWETPVKIPGAVKLSMSPDSEEVNFYADNSLYYNESSMSSEKGELEIALLPDEVLAKIYGWLIDKNGVLVQTVNGRARQFALLGQVDNDVKGRRFVYYCCSAAAPSVEYTTNEKGKKITPAKFSITAIPITVGGEQIVKLSVPYAQENKDVYNGWYDMVYLPDLADGGEVDGEDGEKSIYDMTVTELKAYAEANDIDITGLTLKADILAAIEAFLTNVEED